jgi:transporter family protein
LHGPYIAFIELKESSMFPTGFSSWQIFALGSAVFAALTAVFGKIGVSEVPSNLATFIRTIVILFVSAAMVSLRGEWKRPESLSKHGALFLVLSGIATGLSWLCYYRALQLGPASRVAPVDKLSVPLVMVLAFLLLKETASIQVILGGVLIVAGTLLVALS